MKAILFGGTGMIGQGVLMEALADPDVESLLIVGRGPSGTVHPKVTDLVMPDMFDYSGVGASLSGYDACFFCLGVSSAGMSEGDYTRVTFDLTMAAANALLKANPGMTFCFISGASTDSTEKGSAMWARVKGKTENALLKLGFKAAYMFRPGLIQPMKGIKSRTASYRMFYAAFGWLLPVVKSVIPSTITTTERLGLAMINAVKKGYSTPILETRDINLLAGPQPGKIPLQL
jgi:uncharacterized protein YbjT (DUF2867 family)